MASLQKRSRGTIASCSTFPSALQSLPTPLPFARRRARTFCSLASMACSTINIRSNLVCCGDAFEFLGLEFRCRVLAGHIAQGQQPLRRVLMHALKPFQQSSCRPLPTGYGHVHATWRSLSSPWRMKNVCNMDIYERMWLT